MAERQMSAAPAQANALNTDVCYKCSEPIQYGEPTCDIDINIGANAAGAGNWKRCHSECVGGFIMWNTQPKVHNCACKFIRKDEFSPSTLVEPCGFHAKMQRDLDEAAKLSQEIHDYLKKRDDEKHGLVGNLRCIYDHVLRDIEVPR